MRAIHSKCYFGRKSLLSADRNVSMIAFLTQNKGYSLRAIYHSHARGQCPCFRPFIWEMFLACKSSVFILMIFSSRMENSHCHRNHYSHHVYRYCIRRFPLFVGWFCRNTHSVIGLVQIGGQSFADRYTYLPSIGILIMLAWMIPAVIKERKVRRIILQPAGIFVFVVMSVLTWKQCLYWNNSIALYNRALRVTENNYLAHNNLGLAF